jgi:hypothetical protein
MLKGAMKISMMLTFEMVEIWCSCGALGASAPPTPGVEMSPRSKKSQWPVKQILLAISSLAFVISLNGIGAHTDDEYCFGAGPFLQSKGRLPT